MKIAIDARWIFKEISGIGAYTRELIKHLAILDRKDSYLLLFQDPSLRDRTIQETGTGSAPNFSAEVLPYGVFSLRSQCALPRTLTKLNVDVFHSPNYMIPFLAFPRNGKGRTKCVVTVHDVIPMIFPDHAPRSKKARLYPVYRRLMLEVGLRANRIIVDSNVSKADVIKHLQISPSAAGKVCSIYCGVSERFKPKQINAESRDQKRTRTILYVGRADPYKNLVTLVRAYAEARGKCPFPMTLKLAGSSDPRYPEAMELARELGVAESVAWTGYLSDGDLVSAYEEADILVHPSRYEGFGLQVVEAMACGLPVICSNAGSLPEVAGEAALMHDPDDASGFTKAIVEVLTNDSLARQMSEKGIECAAKFTWSKTAAATLAVYEKMGV